NASIRKDEERRAVARELANLPARVENGDGARSAPAVHIKRDVNDLLENRSGMGRDEYRKALVDETLRSAENKIEDGANQAHFEKLVKRHAKDTNWAQNILARSRPEYQSGWGKLMSGRS